MRFLMKNIKTLLFIPLTLIGLSACSSNEKTYDGYQCQILYRDGTPVSGVMAKYCTEQTCFRPINVDSNGIAKADTLKDDTYYVHVENLPSGYTYNPNAHQSTPTNKQIVIYLDELSEFNSDNGVLLIEENSLFNVSIDEETSVKLRYQSSQAGSYTLESWADYYAATENIDPTIKMLSTSGEQLAIDYDSGVGDNFKLDFELNANDVVEFEISVSADFYPSEFTVNFLKK